MVRLSSMAASSLRMAVIILRRGQVRGSGQVQGNYVPTATPEPATFGLFGGALVLLGFARKKFSAARV